jgi:hypothetical protein
MISCYNLREREIFLHWQVISRMECLALLLGHLVGDYIVQSDNVARTKHFDNLALIKHAAAYATCVALAAAFAQIALPIWSITVVMVSHVLIDRFRLGVIVWQLVNRAYPHEEPRVWLEYVIDNTLHLLVLALVL